MLDKPISTRDPCSAAVDPQTRLSSATAPKSRGRPHISPADCQTRPNENRLLSVLCSRCVVRSPSAALHPADSAVILTRVSLAIIRVRLRALPRLALPLIGCNQGCLPSPAFSRAVAL